MKSRVLPMEARGFYHSGLRMMEEEYKMDTKVEKLFDKKFIRVFDIQYREGRHYYDATRRDEQELVALKDDAAFRAMLPDAVSCVVIVENAGEAPRLLLSREWRYPVWQFLLSVPAGLIDPEDKTLPREQAIFATAVREMKEETGVTVGENDSIEMISPCLFSTPGMTDESNAMVLITLRDHDLSALSQSGAEGSELFDGFVLLEKADAQRILKNGCDDQGVFYSIYTQVALLTFLSRV